MKITNLILIAVVGAMAARADFSYTMTRKSAQGSGETTTVYIKGHKMMTDNGNTTMVMDFDAQTIATFNKSQNPVAKRNRRG
jgi:hypothetical protein